MSDLWALALLATMGVSKGLNLKENRKTKKIRLQTSKEKARGLGRARERSKTMTRAQTSREH